MIWWTVVLTLFQIKCLEDDSPERENWEKKLDTVHRMFESQHQALGIFKKVCMYVIKKSCLEVDYYYQVIISSLDRQNGKCLLRQLYNSYATKW